MDLKGLHPPQGVIIGWSWSTNSRGGEVKGREEMKLGGEKEGRGGSPSLFANLLSSVSDKKEGNQEI